VVKQPVDYPALSSAQIKEKVVLYLYSPSRLFYSELLTVYATDNKKMVPVTDQIQQTHIRII
jgi:hypothetical protein